MASDIIEISIDDFDSLEETILTAKNYCSQMNFDKLAVNMVASAVSEIATNVIKYGDKGQFKMTQLANGKGVRVEILDKGPGISNINQAIQDGFSTDPTSLGVGLGAAKRAMDTLSIQSKEGSGTSITMEKWLPISQEELEYAVVSRADENYMYNGDGYIFKEYGGDCLFVAIIDGLGEGFNAFKTTQSLLNLLIDDFSLDLDVIVKKCETLIKEQYKDSGAAIGILRIKPDKISYLAVGDTFIETYANEKKSFISKDGIVGAFQLPVLKIKEIQNDECSVIVMCTDGIKNNFYGRELPLVESAQYIADYIYLNHKREYGDATVIVIKTIKTE